jgi:hypothetical protein
MSFTRFYDDPARIQKQLEQMTAIGKYQLNVPGNGSNMNYVEDPHIRLEKWGANLSNNSIDIENELRGQNKKLDRDITMHNNIPYKNRQYGTTKGSVNQSRATNPAWELRDKQQHRFNDLPFDPQAHVVLPFHSNLQTRMLEKDYYKNGNN